MRKIAFFIIAMATGCVLFGCTPSVEGDVDYVAEECAELSDSETVSVVVTGSKSHDLPVTKSDDGSASLFIEGDDYSAFLMFEDVDADTLGILNSSDVVTAKGTTMPNLNTEDTIFVNGCELV